MRLLGRLDRRDEDPLLLAPPDGEELERRHLAGDGACSPTSDLWRPGSPLRSVRRLDGQRRLASEELAQPGAQLGVEAHLLGQDVARAGERVVERRWVPRPPSRRAWRGRRGRVPPSPLRIASASGSRPRPRATVARPATTGRCGAATSSIAGMVVARLEPLLGLLVERAVAAQDLPQLDPTLFLVEQVLPVAPARTRARARPCRPSRRDGSARGRRGSCPRAGRRAARHVLRVALVRGEEAARAPPRALRSAARP